MAAMPDASKLKRWIEQSLADQTNRLARGYQGQTLLFDEDGSRLVVKVPHGGGLARWLHVLMLRHEHEVYQRLEGFGGVPACLGMIDRRYLVLEYVEGHTIRERRPKQEDEYFSALHDIVKAMHQRGVAHMDLKRKDNLYVRADNSPCLLDFGAAVIYRPGFHPLNHFRYRLGVQFDINAWVKHSHHGTSQAEIERISQHYRSTSIERLARWIKRLFGGRQDR